MFTNAVLMDALDDVAREFPVDRWRAAGIELWPLVRYEWCTTNFYMYTQHAPPGPSAGGRLQSLVNTVKSGFETLQVDPHKKANLFEQRDLLFYSDGVSFSKFDGTYFEKFCDPLIDVAQTEFGASSVLITPLHRRLVPRYRPSVMVQPQIDAALTASAVAARLWRGATSFDGFDEAMAQLGRKLPGATVPTRTRVQRNAVISVQLSRLCELWLRAVQPKVVFIVAYYGNERAAMVLACRRLGIPCVDIQHGAISEVHFAYARMGRVPVDGYALLPDWFWVWTERERALIEKWSHSSPAHRVVVGGNPFTTFCTAPGNERVSAIARQIDRLIGPKKQVLFTASGFETAEQLRELRTLVTSTADTHAWWIRMHPSRLEAKSRFAAAIPEAAALMEPATSTPMPLVMSRMDLHITEGSSSADEAAMFGVPTILFAKEGQSQFAPLIERGSAVPADGLADIGRVLHSAQLPAKRAVSPNAAREQGDAMSTLLNQNK